MATSRFNIKWQMVISGLLMASASLFGAPASAKIFKNAYVSFELTDKWNCTLEQTEWVCRTSDPGLAEAIIILTAKEVGPQDALSAYETHLKTPRTVITKTGKSLQSSVYDVKQENINNQPWVNGFQLSSEVINYYSRYLATIKDRIAVLVTFSAHRNSFTKYSSDFFRAISTLNVIATKSLWANGTNGGAGGATGPFGAQTGGAEMPADANGGDGEGDGGDGGSSAKALGAFALIIGAIGIYLMLKRGQTPKKKKKR